MNKYIPFLIVVLYVFAGCGKKTDNVTPVPVTPQVTVQTITYPTFANSAWNQVVGGKLVLEFDSKNAKDSITSKIKDSTDIKDLATYDKILPAGKYDINISSGNPAMVADTFMRFKGQITSYTVDNKQAVALTVTSTDGLITINKTFIQDSTVPTFKSDSGSTVYKLGLNNGFYYLYIKGGVKGSISFVSKTTKQQVTQRLSITALNQYNMAVVSTSGSLQVVFVPFKYNQVAVASSTLLTLNIIPSAYSYSTVYFVATDETGKILAETKYIQGTTTLKLAATEPFLKDRFNFFEIEISNDSNTVPNIVGYLQVKKGSVYVNTKTYSSAAATPLKVHLKNVSGFDNLNIGTDQFAQILHSPSDTTTLTPFQYSDKSSLLVQMLKNNKVVYNFFPIPSGTTNYNLDLSAVNKTPNVKTYKAPGNNFSMYVAAKMDKTMSNAYQLGTVYVQYNSLDYYYPTEAFQEYTTLMNYSIDTKNYTITKVGTTIPDNVDSFNASFNVTGTTLATFKPTVSGTFDYYTALFNNNTPGHYLQIVLFSPSAAKFTDIKLPDFSKYLGVSSVDLNTLLLTQFSLTQADGFNEAKFYYDGINTDGPNSKVVSTNYNY